MNLDDHVAAILKLQAWIVPTLDNPRMANTQVCWHNILSRRQRDAEEDERALIRPSPSLRCGYSKRGPAGSSDGASGAANYPRSPPTFNGDYINYGSEILYYRDTGSMSVNTVVVDLYIKRMKRRLICRIQAGECILYKRIGRSTTGLNLKTQLLNN